MMFASIAAFKNTYSLGGAKQTALVSHVPSGLITSNPLSPITILNKFYSVLLNKVMRLHIHFWYGSEKSFRFMGKKSMV